MFPYISYAFTYGSKASRWICYRNVAIAGLIIAGDSWIRMEVYGGYQPTTVVDGDPLFGGGEVVPDGDFEPMTAGERIASAVKTFFYFSLPCLFGVEIGLWRCRRDARKREVLDRL
ncbi:hypothetical protein N9E25_07575 [Verrucomicrobiales bacterium]|nr:hypothetical protein [Verrucomicrobiales bacterium]